MILVTGATGLVGGHLLWHLLQENDKIVAIKRKNSKLLPLRAIFKFYSDSPDKFLERIEWRYADIIDFDSLMEASKGVNKIYHCAAVVSLSGKGNHLMDTNVQGTENIIRIALYRKIEKLCFVSSIAACGFTDNDSTIITEDSEWQTKGHQSDYALSKFNAEQIVWKAIKENGLNAVIVNPGVILGFSGTNSSSSLLFKQVRKGLPFYTLGGSGYVDVRDVVRIMIKLMESSISAERFILVSENNSNKEIISMMSKGFNKPQPIINMGKKRLYFVGFFAEIAGKVFGFSPVLDRKFASSATNRSYYSSQKIIDALNYKFIPISQCIDDVCNYMLKCKP
ncbi:NAD-dependent epimerase/dehydratase family protein [Paludibacter sp.]